MRFACSVLISGILLIMLPGCQTKSRTDIVTKTRASADEESDPTGLLPDPDPLTGMVSDPDPDHVELMKKIEERQMQGLDLAGQIEKKDSLGYWAVGLIVGNKLSSSNEGIIFNSNELYLNWGGSLGSKDYQSKEIVISTYKPSVFEQFSKENTETPLVISYVRSFPLKPVITTRSSHYATGVSHLNKGFSYTPSGKKYGKIYSEPENLRKQSEGGYKKQAGRSGFVVKSSRWGLGLLGEHVCSITLLEKGTKTVHKSCGERCRYTVEVPNINTFNISDEDGCTFLEDAARSGSLVNVESSRQFIEIWKAHANNIHKVEILSGY